MQTLEVGRCLPSGRGVKRASTHYNNMVALHSENGDGVVSMDSQVETVPGPQPQRGPPPTTGISNPEHVPCKGQSRATGDNLNICHWNAEGVKTTHTHKPPPPKLELQTFLTTQNIDVCCIQETHLSPNHRFSVRGFETFRRDREHRPKGGLLILVKNIYPAVEIHRSADEDTEVLEIKLMFGGNPLSIIIQPILTTTKSAPSPRHPAGRGKMDDNGRLQQPLSQLGIPGSWP